MNASINKYSDEVYGVILGYYEIETLVTHNPRMVEFWITDTLRASDCALDRLIVGLDTEWSPRFIYSSHHTVATLQLCVGDRCLIYQIIHATRIPQSLRDFLLNPNSTFVGVGIEEDVRKLWDDWSLLVASRNTKDLRPWAAEKLGMEELRRAGLKRLAKEVVGDDMDKQKSVTCSRWDRRVLSLKQITYACLDAFFSYEIGRRLNCML